MSYAMRDNEALRPLNRAAAMAAAKAPDQAKVLHFKSIVSRDPIPWKNTPNTIKCRAGAKWGTMTCLGFYERHKPTYHRWVCRCSCGVYAIRTGAAILRAAMKDCCPRCQETRYLQRKARYLQNNCNPLTY